MKIINYFIGLCFLGISWLGILPVQAQSIYIADSLFAVIDTQQLLHVKQLSQFFRRFNLQEDLYGNPLVSTDSTQYHQNFMKDLLKRGWIDRETLQLPNEQQLIIQRKLLIYSLFDWSGTDAFGVPLVNDFIELVANENCPIKISAFDTDWYAELNCQVVYKGEEKDLQLVMKKEVYPDQSSKWVMMSAYADFLTAYTPSKKIDKYIDPVSHETNFISLKRVFSNPAYLTNYRADDYKPDHLTILFELIRSAELQYNYVKQLKFHFLQIPGWVFTVERIEDSNRISGWLISNLIRSNHQYKHLYRKNNLHLQ